jgi:2-C-methyl-D-erythritol 4-phosphate cytidylyltransferase
MIAAVIVAAGMGVRMGSALRKQYLSMNGRPMLAHTLMAFDQCPRIDRMVVVVPEDELSFCRREIIDPLRMRAPVVAVAGGTRRQDSVYNGLDVLNGEGVVLIHDGVRPLISLKLIEACIEGALRWNACIPVIAVNDTLKKIDEEGCIETTVSREGLTMAQTPQGFRISLIKQAHHLARLNGWQATDDASLVERSGAAPVHTISGSPLNIKVTTTVDLRWAEALFDLRFDL